MRGGFHRALEDFSVRSLAEIWAFADHRSIVLTPNQ
jgi:hypothetical protein